MCILVVNSTLADSFFNDRFGQFGGIRVEFNQSGHLRSLKFLRFFMKSENFIRADTFGGAAGGGAAPE